MNEEENKIDLDTKIELATQTLERNISFIVNCDNKSSIVLAFIGVILTIILTNDGLKGIFKIIKKCIEVKTFSNILYLLFLGISIYIMLYGIYNLGKVLIAKVSQKADGLGERNSNIFFTGIQKNPSYQNYQLNFCSLTKEQLLDELLSQIYINSEIAIKKYSKFNTGFKNTVIGFVLFISILIIGRYIYY